MKEALPKKVSKELMAQDFTQTAYLALEIEKYKSIAQHYAELECQLAILSDIRRDVSYIYYGNFARQIGLHSCEEEVISSIWEKDILERIHPDDLQRKYIQELNFFKFVKQHPVSLRQKYYHESQLRMRDNYGHYHSVHHRMFYASSETDKSISLALCLYGPLVYDVPTQGRAVDAATGTIMFLNENQEIKVLTKRETQVIRLIEQGANSKQIAETLSISVHTVSRHRQEILSKLKTKSSIEACRVARSLNLL